MGTSLFSLTQAKPYFTHHQVFTPKDAAHPRSLVDAGLLRDFKSSVLPAFMEQAGITDLRENGFRMIVNIGDQVKPTEIHLISGENVPAFCPQDWLSLPLTWDPDAPAPFFELCAEAARAKQPTMKFGNRLFHVDGLEGAFGVTDGDPKVENHLLVLAIERFATMADPAFTVEYWQKFFSCAERIIKTLELENNPTRYIANFGNNFQAGPRVHMHIHNSSSGLLSPFPQDYGFLVGDQGIISAPDNSPKHQQVVDLIKQGLQINGFSTEAKAEKAGIDKKILNLTKSLLI